MRISDWSSDVCSSDLVEPELAGETVTLLWGLFDQQLFVEHDGKRHGPYEPSRGAVPPYRYRKYQKSRAEERPDKVVRLADPLGLPRATGTGGDRPLPSLPPPPAGFSGSSEETTSELQSHMPPPYSVFCLQK